MCLTWLICVIIYENLSFILHYFMRYSTKRVSNDGKEMRFQVPPKTFRLDSWITELDHATNLVVSSKPPGRRLGKPEWRVPKVLQRNREYSVCDRQSRG